jgi:hypothetical protein
MFDAIVRTAADSANADVQMVEIFAENADSLFIGDRLRSSRPASREMVSRLLLPFYILRCERQHQKGSRILVHLHNTYILAIFVITFLVDSFSLAVELGVAVGITRPPALLTGRTARRAKRWAMAQPHLDKVCALQVRKQGCCLVSPHFLA